MAIFNEIKGERTLTMSHWRYRLLHWVFGIENAEEEGPSDDLPDFLYNYYCPLFWFTNLLALLLPLILFLTAIKQITILVFSFVFNTIQIIGGALLYVVRGAVQLYQKSQPEETEQTKKDAKVRQRAYNRYEAKQLERAQVASVIESLQYHFKSNGKTSDIEYIREWRKCEQDIIDRFKYCTSSTPNQEQLNRVKEYLLGLEQALEEKKKRKAIRTARITKVLAIFEPLVKITLFLLGTALVIALVALVVYVSPTLFKITFDICAGILAISGYILTALYNFDLFDFVVWATKFFGTILLAIIALTFAGMYFGPPIWRRFRGTSEIVFDSVKESGSWISDTFNEIEEFFVMMYKNNCPKIKIQKPDDLESDE